MLPTRTISVPVLTFLLLVIGCDAVSDETTGTIARCTCYASRASGDVRVVDRIFELDRCAAADDDTESVAGSLSDECLAELEENNTISDAQQCTCECFLTDDRCVADDPSAGR